MKPHRLLPLVSPLFFLSSFSFHPPPLSHKTLSKCLLCHIVFVHLLFFLTYLLPSMISYPSPTSPLLPSPFFFLTLYRPRYQSSSLSLFSHIYFFFISCLLLPLFLSSPLPPFLPLLTIIPMSPLVILYSPFLTLGRWMMYLSLVLRTSPLSFTQRKVGGGAALT